MEMISKAIVDGSLSSISEEEARTKQAKEMYGANAKVVEEYAPNRKQRRAQKAAKRKQEVSSGK